MNKESNRLPLEQRVEAGDMDAFNRLLDQHRQRLRWMIELRMDRRLQGRIDPSDVIQDAYIEAVARRQSYVDRKPMPFFLWLRFLVGERLTTLHRHHIGTKMRDSRRELSLYSSMPQLSEASSAMLAEQLVGSITGPSQHAIRAERKRKLQEVLNRMSSSDREVIALRHFEQLTRDESAAILGIQASAASKRYIRAMKRLRSGLDGSSGDSSSV